MDENQPQKRTPMKELRDIQAELSDLKRSGEISTSTGQARLREILKMLGVILDGCGEADEGCLQVRTEPFSDEELWENTPPRFRHFLPSVMIRRFDVE
ncbi:hypothetical protein [Sedimentitalea sp. HM32M-2]|uniref:hypothetical protein n=1 Tax=Sedimentitalea sp. HM32M-2 TaxID=3351566 RepID=UPI0036D354C3